MATTKNNILGRQLDVVKILLLMLLLVSCTWAWAQQSQTAKLSGYIPGDVNGKEVFLVQLEGNVAGGCNTSSRFAIDSNQMKFKATRAAVMAAFHSQTPVTVFYHQTCDSFSNSWDIAWVCVGTLPC